jgi:hypothetical protein
MKRTLVLLIAALALPSCGDKSKPAPEAAATPVPQGDVSFKELDFAALPSDFGEAMKVIRGSQRWNEHKKAWRDGATAGGDPRQVLALEMTPALLEEAFADGSAFLLKWQKPEGNFRYMYDWMDKTWVEDDHQVRQAGSLWGLATCFRYKPSKELQDGIDKGLKFWFDATIEGPAPGTLTMKYGKEKAIDSGSVALVSLAITEYLKTDAKIDEAWKKELETKLDGYLAFLQWMQLDNGHIARYFDHRSGKKATKSSPYYDGESLLALTKAARELGKKELVPTIERAAMAMAKTYTVVSWAEDRDSARTKGFFQWGCMAMAEYYQARWKDYEILGDVAISLGYWMAHTHRTLKRTRNHAYAIEGLISAWRIANWRGDVPAQTDLLYNLDRSLHKLSGWQIGGPLAKNNKWLMANNTDDPMAQGGVMNARKPSGVAVAKDVSHQLRIDVTQHQMHAITLGLENVYLPGKI